MPRVLSATYRLQVTRDFPLAAVRARIPYLHDLGVSHLYLSPLLAARAGSTHGYDVVDPARLNPELGTEDELRALADELHGRGMGIVLDIVPNHMAATAENRYWDDVLERGRASKYAEWFDIDWDAPAAGGKLVLPVLGDELPAALERGELRLHIRDSGARVAYFDRTLPLDPATLPRELQLAQLDPAARPAADDWEAGPAGRRRLAKLLDAQHYRLVHWRRAPDLLNYRRFFEVNDLVATRMETAEVFTATHARILVWVQAGILDGLRVDHIDGLRDPAWYLATLRAAVDERRHADAPQPFPIWVEKILSGDESLPVEWPVDGTTGYDFMNEVDDLLHNPTGWAEIEANYRGLRHNPSLSFAAVRDEGKRRVLTGALKPDVARVARLARAWSRDAAALDDAVLTHALVEVMVALPVYRTYVTSPGTMSATDRAVLEAAFGAAAQVPAVNAQALGILRRAFFDPPYENAARGDFVALFQQTTGPATAKGVEDTALYVYTPLASRNEVGGAPDRPLAGAATRMHARNAARAARWPRSLNAGNTHDTKRSADLRARLAALTDDAGEWSRHIARWRKLNRGIKRIVRGKPAPDTNGEHLFYQSVLGLWPAPRPQRRVDDLPDAAWMRSAADRLAAYMLKAAREAKTRTSWTEGDTQYEKALEAFVRESLGAAEPLFAGDVARLAAKIANAGFARSLARTMIHFLSPGVPDVYQGGELWTFSLVDPDNRRPVDFDRAESLLARSGGRAELLRDALDGPLVDDRVKQALVARLLRFRREHPGLIGGEYLPIEGVSGFLAFGRRAGDELAIALARTDYGSTGTTETRGSRVTLDGSLAGRYVSALTDREVELVRSGGQVEAWRDELVPPRHPCDLLWRARQ